MTGCTCLTKLLSTFKMIIQLIDSEDNFDIYYLDFSLAFDIINHRLSVVYPPKRRMV